MDLYEILAQGSTPRKNVWKFVWWIRSKWFCNKRQKATFTGSQTITLVQVYDCVRNFSSRFHTTIKGLELILGVKILAQVKHKSKEFSINYRGYWFYSLRIIGTKKVLNKQKQLVVRFTDSYQIIKVWTFI